VESLTLCLLMNGVFMRSVIRGFLVSVCMTEICSGLCSRDFIFGASGMEQNFTGYFRLGHSSKGEILRLLEQFFYRLDWMLMLSAN